MVEDQKTKMEELKRKHQEEYQKTRQALRLVSSDVNFQIVMRHLAKICGFFQSTIALNATTNEINSSSTIFNEGRRTVYLDMRRMMTDEVRRIIESKNEEDKQTNDEQKGR
jgi:uncharacterized protein YjgD (DUF1641 family)